MVKFIIAPRTRSGRVMKIVPSEFSCTNLEHDDVVVHIIDQFGHVVETNIYANIWNIVIKWQSQEPKIKVNLLPYLVKVTPELLFVTPTICGFGKVNLDKAPCVISESFVIVLGDENHLNTKMYLSLLNPKNATSFLTRFGFPPESHESEGQIMRRAKEFFSKMGGQVV